VELGSEAGRPMVEPNVGIKLGCAHQQERLGFSVEMTRPPRPSPRCGAAGNVSEGCEEAGVEYRSLVAEPAAPVVVFVVRRVILVRGRLLTGFRLP